MTATPKQEREKQPMQAVYVSDASAPGPLDKIAGPFKTNLDATSPAGNGEFWRVVGDLFDHEKVYSVSWSSDSHRRVFRFRCDSHYGFLEQTGDSLASAKSALLDELRRRGEI